MKITLALLCVLALSVGSHAQTLKKRGKAYFQFHDKIGLIVDTKIQAVPDADAAGGGLVGGLVSASIAYSKDLEKFDFALQKIESKVNPLSQAQTFFQNIYVNKGKEVTMLDIDYNSLPDFAAPNYKWPTKDVRSLKDNYGIDGLVHITVDYGMMIKIAYGIVTRKSARCRIITEIITTSGNEYIVHELNTTKTKIDDGWDNPPDYGTLQVAIREAIQQSLARQKLVYDKQ